MSKRGARFARDRRAAHKALAYVALLEWPLRLRYALRRHCHDSDAACTVPAW